ncbi:hypothetical protein vBEcoMWL3_gp251c [Escherichia phage vB_EcoM_WL-3]|nr:hypothetical protein vBEcoMWL3_gp251c [Escherichia phage vB_EcoM_WL-3]
MISLPAGLKLIPPEEPPTTRVLPVPPPERIRIGVSLLLN